MKLSIKKQIEFEVLYKSLIGKKIEIIESSNKKLIGLKGTLIFESSNLLHLDINSEIKKILKSSVILKVEFDKNKIKLDGKLLVGTLTNRIKKLK